MLNTDKIKEQIEEKIKQRQELKKEIEVLRSSLSQIELWQMNVGKAFVSNYRGFALKEFQEYYYVQNISMNGRYNVLIITLYNDGTFAFSKEEHDIEDFLADGSFEEIDLDEFKIYYHSCLHELAKMKIEE